MTRRPAPILLAVVALAGAPLAEAAPPAGRTSAAPARPTARPAKAAAAPPATASAPAPKPAVTFTRDPAGACALKLARAVSLNTSQSASDLAYAITQRCLKDEPLSGTCAIDARSPCEVRDDAKFLLLQQIAMKLVLSIRLDDVIARSPK